MLVALEAMLFSLSHAQGSWASGYSCEHRLEKLKFVIVHCSYCAFMSQLMMAVYMDGPMFMSDSLFATLCLHCVFM